MYIIVEKETDFIVTTATEIIDNNDGTFVDCYDDFLYNKEAHIYYQLDMDTLPKGVRLGTHGYNPEKGGFYPLMSILELNELRHKNRQKLKRQIDIENMFIEVSEKLDNIYVTQEALEYMLNHTSAIAHTMFILYKQMNNKALIEDDSLHLNMALIAFDLLSKNIISMEDIPDYLIPYITNLQQKIEEEAQKDAEKNEAILNDTKVIPEEEDDESIVENIEEEE